MGFRVLSAEGQDGALWSAYIDRLPNHLQDIHFLPEYGRIYQETYGYVPFLAVYENRDRFVVQPFVKRLLNDLPFLKKQPTAGNHYDISNAYGFGGPLTNARSPSTAVDLVRIFRRRFHEFCLQAGIASEFICFHPLLKNHQTVKAAGEPAPSPQKEVVYLDLTLTAQQFRRGISRGHRSSINKARRNGVRIVKVPADAANLAVFKRCYYRTMQRQGAAERWYFPDGYFENCCKWLGTDRVSLFFAFVGETPASCYFLMHDFFTVYYHFGGSDDRYHHLRTNTLLMHEAAEWARRKKFRFLHLGGGVTSSSSDTLLRFKAGFSPYRATLYTAGMKHCSKTYDRLCDLKRRQERAGDLSVCDPAYFPLYRR